MFKVVKDSQNGKHKKKTIAGNILESAWEEISAISEESGASLSVVVSQMIYECLGRDKVTGFSKEE